MKKNLLLSLTSLVLLSVVWMGHNVGEAKAVQKDRTGSPFTDGTCAKSGCHNGGNFNTTLNVTLANNQGTIVTKYKAGNTYEVKVQVSGTGASGYGFQLTALNSSNNMAGTFSNSPVAQIIKLGNIFYVEQPSQNISGIWKFSWTAPAVGSGPIKFYASGLACNNDKFVAGDQNVTILKNLEETTATYEIAKSFSVKLNSITKTQLNLELKADASDTYMFEILDFNGRILIAKKETLESGTNNKEFNLSNMNQGIYLLHISKADGDMLTKKFIVN